MFANHLHAFYNALTPDDQPKLPAEEFLRQWTVADIRKMVYDESDAMGLTVGTSPHPQPPGQPR